jgi:hypothetical protein
VSYVRAEESIWLKKTLVFFAKIKDIFPDLQKCSTAKSKIAIQHQHSALVPQLPRWKSHKE